jgi:hypothetical protein
MRLPRMTTRRWIVIVLISASLLASFVGIGRFLRLASEFRLRARFHALQESVIAGGELFKGPGGMYAYQLPRRPDQVDYHSKMRQKYERAAARPWLPIEPDAPEPE